MRYVWMKVVVVLLAGAAGIGTAVGVSAAAGGGGSTTLGVATEDVGSTVGGGSTPSIYFMAADDPGVPSYGVPAGGGVISQWSAALGTNPAPATLTLDVLHPGGGTQPTLTETVAATDAQAVPVITTPDTVLTFTTRVPVTGGDRLGVFLSGGLAVAAEHVDGSPAGVGIAQTQPSIGGALTTQSYYDRTHMELSAVVEPDADHDGYGDSTQDACPADATAHLDPCPADLVGGAVATPSKLAVGGVGLVVVTVASASGQPTDPRVGITLPAGLTALAATGGGGVCTGSTAITCGLGAIAPGASATALVAVQATKAGTLTVPVVATGDGADPNLANNRGTAIVNVSAASAVIKQCTVPPVAGLTQAKAKTLLKTFGCLLGTVKKAKSPKHRKGYRVSTVVKSSSPKATTRAALNTKVNVTLVAKQIRIAKAKR